MNGSFKLKMMVSLVTTGLAVAFAGQAPQSKSQDDAGVREAIRFERAKAAADARQARIEAGRASKPAENPGADKQQTSKQESSVQDAIRFERAKDAADARQARSEAKSNGTQVVASSKKRQ